MEGAAARDPRGLGDPPAGTVLVPRRLLAAGSPPGAAAVSGPPVLIVQQLPGPGAAPGTPPVWGGIPGESQDALGSLELRDLMELMLIQTSQMHQLLMHGLAMAALMPLGVRPAPAPAPAQGQEEEEEEEAVVFHHHYVPWPAPSPVPVRFLRSSPGDERAVPPPPPPSATGTVGPGVPPAAEFYSAEERRL